MCQSVRTLQISDNPEIKRIWDGMVEENLRLYEFAQELTRLSRMYGVINNFPEEELKNLRGFYELYDIPDNKNKNAQDTLVYNLGFITLNSGIKVGDDSLLPRAV